MTMAAGALNNTFTKKFRKLIRAIWCWKQATTRNGSTLHKGAFIEIKGVSVKNNWYSEGIFDKIEK